CSCKKQTRAPILRTGRRSKKKHERWESRRDQRTERSAGFGKSASELTCAGNAAASGPAGISAGEFHLGRRRRLLIERAHRARYSEGCARATNAREIANARIVNAGDRERAGS